MKEIFEHRKFYFRQVEHLKLSGFENKEIIDQIIRGFMASGKVLFIFMIVQKTNETVHMSLFKVMHNYNQLMVYLIWPFKNKLKMDDFPTSPNAAEHFAECKQLFVLAVLVFIICLVLHFIFKKQRKKALLDLNKSAALILLLLPIVVFPFAVSNFDSFFVIFHHILFNNNDWLFDPNTDPIINVLTEGFFASALPCAAVIWSRGVL